MTVAQLRNALSVIPRGYDDCPVVFHGPEGTSPLIAVSVNNWKSREDVVPVISLLPSPEIPGELDTPMLFMMPGDIVR